jgi:ATP-dependent RNA helicase DDX21
MLCSVHQAEEIDQVSATASFRTLLDDDEDEQEVEEVEVDVDSNLLVANLGFSAETTQALLNRGITSLFPIQGIVLQPALEGRDLIGRAKTGSGKTLAFALPVVESLLAEDKAAGGKMRPGRSPRCVVLAPTRELANQVAKEFASVSPRHKVLSVYGGTSINTQVSHR